MPSNALATDRAVGSIPAVIGGLASLVAVEYGWWAGVADAGGSLVVLAAAVLATLELGAWPWE